MQIKSILTVLATGLSMVAAQEAADTTMTSTATMTLTVTITSCNPTVSNCPGATTTSTSSVETSSVVVTTSSGAPIETSSSVVVPSSSSLSWSFPQVNSTTLAGPTASQPVFVTSTQIAIVTASQPASPSAPVTGGAAGLSAQSGLVMGVLALGAALVA